MYTVKLNISKQNLDDLIEALNDRIDFMEMEIKHISDLPQLIRAKNMKTNLEEIVSDLCDIRSPQEDEEE